MAFCKNFLARRSMIWSWGQKPLCKLEVLILFYSITLQSFTLINATAFTLYDQLQKVLVMGSIIRLSLPQGSPGQSRLHQNQCLYPKYLQCLGWVLWLLNTISYATKLETISVLVWNLWTCVAPGIWLYSVFYVCL